MTLLERFKKYIAFDTVSDEESTTYPSTATQLAFGDMLVRDLKEIGITDVIKDEFGLIYAHVDIGKERTIGLIAHMDTAPTIAGGCTNTKLVENYDGSVIKLNDKYSLDPAKLPELLTVKGEDLLVTDGEHLLGGDDKAGIVIIFEFAKYFIEHKDEFNCNLAIAFTPDEEIGAGWKKFDVKKMRADFAYTLDGGPIYIANHENFNAASANVLVYGVGTHPGSAKDIMENAAWIASKINSLLPEDMVPEKTENYEGFIHLTDISGDCETARMHYILRDHNAKLLQEKKELLTKACEKVQKEHTKAVIKLEIKDDYRNMGDFFIEHPEGIEIINKAYLASKVKLQYEPIRGGTDGAMITYMGLPCPNLGDGDFNPHGRFEYVSVTQMIKMVEILKNFYK